MDKIADEMKIEPVFQIKRRTIRKKHFNKNSDTNRNREQESAQENFRTSSFLVLVKNWP